MLQIDYLRILNCKELKELSQRLVKYITLKSKHIMYHSIDLHDNKNVNHSFVVNCVFTLSCVLVCICSAVL